MSTTRETVMSIVSSRYPCSAIPYGDMAKIANEVGVTRERVRQIVSNSGYESAVFRLGRLLCRDCGAVMREGLKEDKVSRSRCQKCKTTPFVCAGCGVEFRISTTTLLSRAKDPRYTTGRHFCSRQCHGAVAGAEYGWGSPSHPNRKRNSSGG